MAALRARPVEFLSSDEIRRKYGLDGIQDFVETSGGVGAITDDTQMTLFTAEALIREFQDCNQTGAEPDYPTAVYRAYLRWLQTQGETSRDPNFRECLDGELLKVEELLHRRAPGNTCLCALIAGKMGTVAIPARGAAGYAGCPGGPVLQGIAGCRRRPEEGEMAFELGCSAVAITHGHPLGYLPAVF